MVHIKIGNYGIKSKECGESREIVVFELCKLEGKV
jgi:hypothetical protein